MMKRLLGLLAITVVMIITVACGSSAKVEADSKKAFISISEDGVFTEYKHIETGCHYLYQNSSQSDNVTQMFVEKDGVSVPYCD